MLHNAKKLEDKKKTKKRGERKYYYAPKDIPLHEIDTVLSLREVSPGRNPYFYNEKKEQVYEGRKTSGSSRYVKVNGEEKKVTYKEEIIFAKNKESGKNEYYREKYKKKKKLCDKIYSSKLVFVFNPKIEVEKENVYYIRGEEKVFITEVEPYSSHEKKYALFNGKEMEVATRAAVRSRECYGKQNSRIDKKENATEKEVSPIKMKKNNLSDHKRKREEENAYARTILETNSYDDNFFKEKNMNANLNVSFFPGVKKLTLFVPADRETNTQIQPASIAAKAPRINAEQQKLQIQTNLNVSFFPSVKKLTLFVPADRETNTKTQPTGVASKAPRPDNEIRERQIKTQASFFQTSRSSESDLSYSSDEELQLTTNNDEQENIYRHTPSSLL